MRLGGLHYDDFIPPQKCLVIRWMAVGKSDSNGCQQRANAASNKGNVLKICPCETCKPDPVVSLLYCLFRTWLFFFWQCSTSEHSTMCRCWIHLERLEYILACHVTVHPPRTIAQSCPLTLTDWPPHGRHHIWKSGEPKLLHTLRLSSTLSSSPFHSFPSFSSLPFLLSPSPPYPYPNQSLLFLFAPFLV